MDATDMPSAGVANSAEYVWLPAADYVEHANVLRLARAHGIESLERLRGRSVADIGWYWNAVVEDLQLPFRVPYSAVVDLAAGIEHPDWFVGARLNIVDACVRRWAADPASRARPALIHEAENGAIRSLTYAELDQQVRRAAAGLRRLGLGRGDPIALFLPMIPEAMIALYAIASIGAIVVPLFSGFAAQAVAARLQDAGAKAVIVADATVRRERTLAMKPLLDEALRSCPSVAHVVVVANAGAAPNAPGEVSWPELVSVSPEAEAGDPEPMAADDVLLLAYTSGTTGRPKGAVHTHAGFLVKTASEVAYSFDVSRGSVFFWVTDMGWIMGPLSAVGTHANGAVLLIYEGSVDVPDLSRLWDLVQRHRVTMLGVSPTLIRTLRTAPGLEPSGFDLSSVHVIGSTGEPWDPSSYTWLARDVFASRVPVINFSGGTEVGGSFLAPYPVERIRGCSLGGPSLGMDVDVLDASGRPVRGEAGELVCRQPWPSMTRGVWRDEARYREAYWSTFPGVWRHGDFAMVDTDGQWFILGRSDDVMNVAGKRLAPAEVESIMAKHPAVAEVAAVGIPDATKGETVWAFWVAYPHTAAEMDISAELRQLVADQLGKPFAPSEVVQVPQLPKTRSAKILRRAVRAAALNIDPGDLSGAENPDAVELIRSAVARKESRHGF
jgi:acetyl-CoA synthetase